MGCTFMDGVQKGRRERTRREHRDIDLDIEIDIDRGGGGKTREDGANKRRVTRRLGGADSA